MEKSAGIRRCRAVHRATSWDGWTAASPVLTVSRWIPATTAASVSISSLILPSRTTHHPAPPKIHHLCEEAERLGETGETVARKVARLQILNYTTPPSLLLDPFPPSTILRPPSSVLRPPSTPLPPPKPLRQAWLSSRDNVERRRTGPVHSILSHPHPHSRTHTQHILPLSPS